MKNLYALIFLALASNIYAQTDSIEKLTLYNRMTSKKITPEEFAFIGTEWKETIKKMDKYPELPLNADGKVEYAFLSQFENMQKEILFTRTMEWLSIVYGFIPANMYSNLQEGKIICNNSINLAYQTSCNYIYIFTIKDERVLIEFVGISYQQTGDYLTKNYSIDNIFPVILQKKSEWEFYLKLLKNTDAHCNDQVSNLSDYIANYDSRYNF